MIARTDCSSAPQLRFPFFPLILFFPLALPLPTCSEDTKDTLDAGDTDTDADTDTDTDTDGDTDTGTDTDSDMDSDTDSDTDTDTDTDTGTDTGSDCTPDSYQACGADGDVHWFDSCDVEGDEVDDCIDAMSHGACLDGVCGCAPGWIGDWCSTCVVFVVGEAGSDFATGSSWGEGLETLEAGLDDAEGDGCYVWVKAGTYFPTEDGSGSTVPADQRTKTFKLRSEVDVYGGFAGDEALLSERDVAANETILSGDIGTSGDNSDNSYHVVTAADDAKIDGFTVTGGNANGMVDPQYLGGGMYFEDSGTTHVSRCSFSNNSAGAGGGMFIDSSNPTVANCNFSNNSAGAGGGIRTFNVASDIENCSFWDNSATNGGAVYIDSLSSIDILNCTFAGNSATSGGGIYNTTGTGVANSILWGDTATSGSEIFNSFGTATVSYSAVQGGYTGTGNIDVDPLFVNDDTDAGVIDLRLQDGSPCIDTGLTVAAPQDTGDLDNDGDVIEVIPFDVDGDQRIVDGDADGTATVDMGAYEYQP
jgi:predicted outer membrane repeat protein